MKQNAQTPEQPATAFRYSDCKDAKFLLGAYRSEKNQLAWIRGESPYSRSQKLYNVRVNDSLFCQRDGGVISMVRPDYVLLYDCHGVSEGYHLFECQSSVIMTEDEMRSMDYPDPQGTYMTYVLGNEMQAEPLDMEALVNQTHGKSADSAPFSPVFITGEDVASRVDYTREHPAIVASAVKPTLRFIDLFAGIGGIRCGLEQAALNEGLTPVCVFTSEIKPYAVKVLHENHPTETITGDITKVDTADIPDFDVLCAGFPCQAFSSAGKRQGFADTRGTMFFQVERILRDKKPQGFILENVEGLVNHDGGRTLEVITQALSALGYQYDFKVLNSKHFGVPQERKRIYIVGSRTARPDLENFPVQESKLSDILEHGKPTSDTPFVRNLLSHFTVEQLYGKAIKDKRGGNDNIHSWDLETKGPVTRIQKQLLDQLLKERRKKKWADIIGIDWMDGMPLTLEQIRTFFDVPELPDLLDDLVGKDYLKFEHPKKLIVEYKDGIKTTHREPDTSKPKGYNIVAGKLSFEVGKVMSPDEIAPTLVAMDMQKLYVGDGNGIRRLTLREGLRLCGYPDTIRFNVSERDGFDLLGNTVVVPVIKAVAGRLLKCIDLKN